MFYDWCSGELGQTDVYQQQSASLVGPEVLPTAKQNPAESPHQTPKTIPLVIPLRNEITSNRQHPRQLLQPQQAVTLRILHNPPVAIAL